MTFGKGFGVSGAAVLCSNTVADYLLQFARHLIYSTSMPPAQAQALRASLAVIRSDEGDARREKLAALITRFRAGVQDLPFTLAGSCSAIQPLIVGDNSRANWQKNCASKAAGSRRFARQPYPLVLRDCA